MTSATRRCPSRPPRSPGRPTAPSARVRSRRNGCGCWTSSTTTSAACTAAGLRGSRSSAQLARDRGRVRHPGQPFLDLIEANRQDQVVSRYQTFDDLRRLLRAVGQPGGPDRAVRVRRVSRPAGPALSDQVCTALQLAEHWQDVAEDCGPAGSTCPPRTSTGSAAPRPDLAAPSARPRLRAADGVRGRARARACSTPARR